MKFTKIRLNGLVPVDLTMIGALPTDKYVLKDADGLGPVEVDVALTRTAFEGNVYQGRRPQNRQIVLNVALNANYNTGQTSSDLRDELYGLLTPSEALDYVGIDILSGSDVKAIAKGWVRRIVPNIFSKDPSVQIVIDCEGSYLEAPADVSLTGLNKTNPVINNLGNAPSGFRMEITFTAPVSLWSIKSVFDNKGFEVDYDFLTGYRLAIDTRPGKRSILIANSPTNPFFPDNFVGALTSSAKWLILAGGANTYVTNDQNFTWGDVIYRPRYWGV